MPAANTGLAPTPPTRDPSANRRRVGAIAALVSIAAALAVVLVLMIVTAGRHRDDFDMTPTTQLVHALESRNLAVCGSQQSAGVHSQDAVSTEVLAVATPGDCGNATNVQIDAYRTRARRDAAARSAEGVDRARSAGTVWTWHQYTVYLQGDDASRDPGVRDRIVAALSAVGAS